MDDRTEFTDENKMEDIKSYKRQGILESKDRQRPEMTPNIEEHSSLTLSLMKLCANVGFFQFISTNHIGMMWFSMQV